MDSAALTADSQKNIMISFFTMNDDLQMLKARGLGRKIFILNILNQITDNR